MTGRRPQDRCNSSTTTYPIRATGCGLIVYEPCIRGAATLTRSHRSDSGGSSQGRVKGGSAGPTHAARGGSRNRRGVAKRPGKQRIHTAERHDRKPLPARGTEQVSAFSETGPVRTVRKVGEQGGWGYDASANQIPRHKACSHFSRDAISSAQTVDPAKKLAHRAAPCPRARRPTTA